MKKLLLSIFLLFPILCFCQGWKKYFKEESHREVYVYGDSFYIVANILFEEFYQKTNDEKFYTWYQGGMISSTEGNYFGNLLDEEYTMYTRQGQVILSGSYYAGLKHGNWIYYDEKGNKQKIESYKKGSLNGKVKKYKEGELRTITSYKDGRKHGWMLEYRNGSFHKIVKYKDDKVASSKEEKLEAESTEDPEVLKNTEGTGKKKSKKEKKKE